MTVKYIHIRRYNKKGTLLQRGGSTIAYQALETSDGNIAVAYYKQHVHTPDPYNRQTGRNESSSKLLDPNFEKKYLTVAADASIIEAILNDVGYKPPKNAPSRKPFVKSHESTGVLDPATLPDDGSMSAAGRMGSGA
jgi:hypothetical protein